MLEKIITLGGYTNWGPEYISVHNSSLTKIAADCYTPASLLDVMTKLVPRPEGRYILLNALGAHEYWGENMNGDAFPEWSLKGEAPPKAVVDIVDLKVKPKIPDFVIPTGRYGHETFVTDAKVYVGHANTDPTKAIGDVIASAYNDKMHRVELIVFIYKDRNPELIHKIDTGEPVPFSMGARLRFDVCSVCLNIARTRAEYCEHLTHLLRQTLPDGRKVYSYNFFPRFFDISAVKTPADRSAWALRKVASRYETATLPTRLAVDKLADIVKNEVGSGETLGTTPVNPKLIQLLTSRAVDAYTEPKEDLDLTDAVRRFKINKVLASLSAMGVILRPSEVIKLSSSQKVNIPTTFSFADIEPTLIREMTPTIQARTLHNTHLTKRAARTCQTTGSLDMSPAVFADYVSYLKSIDFNKLAAWLDTSPVANITLHMETFLKKVAGLATQETSRIQCLPTACLVSFLNQKNSR